jgi:hypothetical protein
MCQTFHNVKASIAIYRIHSCSCGEQARHLVTFRFENGMFHSMFVFSCDDCLERTAHSLAESEIKFFRESGIKVDDFVLRKDKTSE